MAPSTARYTRPDLLTPVPDADSPLNEIQAHSARISAMSTVAHSADSKRVQPASIFDSTDRSAEEVSALIGISEAIRHARLGQIPTGAPLGDGVLQPLLGQHVAGVEHFV